MRAWGWHFAVAVALGLGACQPEGGGGGGSDAPDVVTPSPTPDHPTFQLRLSEAADAALQVAESLRIDDPEMAQQALNVTRADLADAAPYAAAGDVDALQQVQDLAIAAQAALADRGPTALAHARRLLTRLRSFGSTNSQASAPLAGRER